MNWLLLRGLMRDQRHFMDFPAAIERASPGARVFCLDAPGLGTERGRRSPASVDAIMEDLRTRFLPLRARHDGPWGLFSISLGGMIGLSWCHAYRDDFAHLVVTNSSARNVSPLLDRVTVPAIATFARVAFARDALSRERALLALASNLRSDREALAREWATFSPEAGLPRDVALAQLLAATRFRAPSRVTVPMTIVCSEGDRLVRAASSRALAARYGAELRVHPDAGHDLPLDDGPWLAARLAAIAGDA